jgi:AraC family transcriptional regulator of adaptative response/methylated-DNA-[protein]-cysteine methyltransferase
MDSETCWQAVQNRDRSQDGRFYFGVITTGVYCRPSCGARLPLRQNVRFYPTPQEAERDGLRPCLRCRPTSDDGERMRELAGYLEQHSGEQITLGTLAERSGLSRFHLQRTFKREIGLTPKQYLDAQRMKHFKQGLREARDVTEAVYEAGFGSASRVYERAYASLGMTPKAYRQGGRGVAITWAAADSPLGTMLIGATDRGICFLQFGDSPEALVEELRHEYPKARIEEMRGRSPEFEGWIQGLRRYLETGQPAPLPGDVRGTAFQRKVWNYLQGIPEGQVRSYAEVAAGIGEPKAVRAVARACAANRVAIVIPCHRVIRGNGEIGGYRWGVGRKRALLELERNTLAAPGLAGRQRGRA